jgi:hypothetical protein
MQHRAPFRPARKRRTSTHARPHGCCCCCRRLPRPGGTRQAMGCGMWAALFVRLVRRQCCMQCSCCLCWAGLAGGARGGGEGRQEGTRAGAGQGTRGKRLIMTPPCHAHGCPITDLFLSCSCAVPLSVRVLAALPEQKLRGEMLCVRRKCFRIQTVLGHSKPTEVFQNLDGVTALQTQTLLVESTPSVPFL